MTGLTSFLLRRFFYLVSALSFIAPVCAITIDDAFNNAVKVDPALRSSRYNQEASSENIAIARSRLLPQISLQGSSNQLTQTTTQDLPGNTSISKSFTGPSSNHQFVIRQALLRPKEILALNFAELQVQYGQVKYQSDLSDLWLRVANSWIDLVGAAQLVEAYAKPLTTLQLAAKQEKAKFIQGDGTKDLVAEAEAQFNLAEAMYQQAFQSLKAKQKAFELLTQLQSRSLADKRLDLEPKAVLSDNDREKIWMNKKDTSFELRLAEIQLALQRERVRMARADHLPTLDILAAMNLAKNDATSTQGYRYKNNQIGIQYVVPIYTGGALSAAQRQAGLSLEATIADNEAIANRLEVDFQIMWSAGLGQISRVHASHRLMESSKEQLRASQLSFAHGVKSISDLANAELSLSRREVEQIILVMEYLKYLVRISKNDFIENYLQKN